MKPKIALVTGASRGIGREIAWQLARDGMQVMINYASNREAAQEALEQIRQRQGRAELYQADVSDSQKVNEMVQQIINKHGHIDVLVNNAGLMLDHLVEEITDEEWERVMAVNLNSMFYTCRAVIPQMKARRYGRIINLSSQAALTGSAQHAHYAASKSAFLGFSYSLAKELGPYGITCNIVSPGRIETDMLSVRQQGRLEEWMAQTPLRSLGHPQDVAHAVSYLASDQAKYVTGHNLHVNGGLLMG